MFQNSFLTPERKMPVLARDLYSGRERLLNDAVKPRNRWPFKVTEGCTGALSQEGQFGSSEDAGGFVS